MKLNIFLFIHLLYLHISSSKWIGNKFCIFIKKITHVRTPSISQHIVYLFIYFCRGWKTEKYTKKTLFFAGLSQLSMFTITCFSSFGMNNIINMKDCYFLRREPLRLLLSTKCQLLIIFPESLSEMNLTCKCKEFNLQTQTTALYIKISERC